MDNRDDDQDNGFAYAVVILRRIGWSAFATIAAICALMRLLTILAAKSAGGSESWEKTLMMTCWMAMSFIIALAIDRAVSGE